MLTIVLAMFAILLLAGAVVAYAAFPHRGEDLPALPWLSAAVRKGMDRVSTIDETEEVHLRR